MAEEIAIEIEVVVAVLVPPNRTMQFSERDSATWLGGFLSLCGVSKHSF